jgi:hypothetical protein
MDKLEFAASLIRPAWATKFKDRTYINLIGAALGAIGTAITVWNTSGVTVAEKMNYTYLAVTAVAAVIAAWNHSQTKKDGVIGAAALQNAQTINAAGDVNLDKDAPTPATNLKQFPELAKVVEQASPVVGAALSLDLSEAAERVNAGITAPVNKIAESPPVDLPEPTQWDEGGAA